MRETRFAKLSAFVAVADCGSFTKAAAQLGLSTSSLSHTIRELEESLGVRLLNRTTRSVAPTEAGERMLTRLRLCVPKTLSALIARPNRLNLSGDDRADLLLPDPVRFAVQVEEPT